MLRLEKTFSVEDDILPALRKQPGGITPPPKAERGGTVDRPELLLPTLFRHPDARDARVRIVGQELGFLLLFAWDGCIGGKGEDRKTSIALLNLETNVQVVLYTHTEVTEVVAASVNHECTLLGFTTLMQYSNAESPDAFEDVYESYLVEVQSQRPMLFNFNTPRLHYQRVQFLYSESRTLSHLLLFRHKESIDVFAIHTGSGPQGIEIVDPPPHSEEIARRFIWFQFDLSRQSIYFLYLRPSQRCALGYDTMLKCVQFSSKNRYDVKLDIALPLESLWAGFADHKTEYTHAPCSHSLVFSPFNMEVVHMRGQGMCVCFQHAPVIPSAAKPGGEGEADGADMEGDGGASASGSTAAASPEGPPESSVSYSVFVLHHGCTLTYTIPLPDVPAEELYGLRLHFSAINDLLLVFLPGHALQLVDCGSRHEPGHHLVLLGDEVPTLPRCPRTVRGNVVIPPTISYFQLIKQGDGRNAYGLGMFDTAHGVAYTFDIDRDFIFSYFTRPQVSLATRTAALHLAIVHLADPSLVKRIMEYYFAVNPEGLHPALLKEYLIGNAYMNMQQHCMERDLLRLLPITSIPTYYQELHGGSAGNAFASECPIQYFYAKLDSHALVEGIPSGSFDSLHVQKTEQEVTRFAFDILHDRHAEMRERALAEERERRAASRRASSLRDTPPQRRDKGSDPGSDLKRFTASIMKKTSFFRQKSRDSPTGERPLIDPNGAAALTRTPSRNSSYSSSPSRRGSTMSIGTPRGMAVSQDEEAVFLYKRFLYHLHTHLRRFCTTASKEQCHDWANDYHNCQFLQSSEIFRLMNNVRTSPATVLATAAAVDPSAAPAGTPGATTSGPMRLTRGNLKAAFEGPPDGMANFPASPGSATPGDDTMSVDSHGEEALNDKVLFQLMERMYSVIQEISFPFPQGFHHRFVTLAYRSLPRPLFRQHVSSGVLRVTEEFVARTLDQLSEHNTPADDRFKYFIISQLSGDALARGLKQWPHPNSQRFLADATVASVLADSELDPGNAVEDDGAETLHVSTGRVGFPPLRSFMRKLHQLETAASMAPRSAHLSARVPLSAVEDAALLSSTAVSKDHILDVSF
eukprot:m.65625 g.65625  ORF g.65625 m.65625 type:complete len:1089 (+) comp8306_c0_seq1:172-3438(+)